MDIREWIWESMVRARKVTLSLVQDLSPEEMRWRPVPGANSTAFLLFHIFRAEDFHFHKMMDTAEELWVSEGWLRKWELPASIPNEGSPVRPVIVGRRSRSRSGHHRRWTNCWRMGRRSV